MVEKGIRGEIILAVERYAKAHNKYMKDIYNPNEESTYLQYLNANNLYGWATHAFLQKEAEDFTPEKIDKLVKKNKGGYLLKVDWSILRICRKIIMSCHFQQRE